MTMTMPSHSGESNAISSRVVSGEHISFPQAFDLMNAEVPFAVGVLVSTLPRGGVQIIQPQRVHESMVKQYAKDFAGEDRALWSALKKKRGVAASSCWTPEELKGSRFVQHLLRPLGLAWTAAAHVQSPVFPGYHGAIWLGRTQEQGDFTPQQLNQIQAFASDLGNATAQVRVNRTPKTPDAARFSWMKGISSKVFIFDEKLKQHLPAENPVGLDGVLHDHMIQHARRQFDAKKNNYVLEDRALLPDSEGDNWIFHVRHVQAIPALGEGEFIVLSLQPEYGDWLTLSNTDFQADPELSRLVPAVKFMQREYKTSPTLQDVAKQVHLSPFHFHRRFTEMMGLTPKHFLLECQIHEAKLSLVGNKELPQIATDCGFAHQSHFTSRFKQTTGLTPTRWKRMALRRNGEPKSA